MKPTRTTQPYRPEGGREPGLALDAMLAGRSLHGQNPMDLQRDGQGAQPVGDGRPARRPRAPRRERAPRPFRSR